MEGFHESSRLFSTGLELVDEAGRRLAARPATLPDSGDGTITPDFLAKAIADGFVVSRPVRGRESGLAEIAMAVPVRGRSGTGRLVLVGVIRLQSNNFLGALYDTPVGGSGGLVLVSPRDGVFLGASDADLVLRPVPPSGLHRQHDLAMQGVFGVGLDRRADGVEEVAATAPVPSAGWFVVARIPTQELFASINRLSRRILTLGGIALVAVALGGLVILRTMLGPLRRSALLADRMSRGETPFAPLPVERADEVGHLTLAFNKLQASLLHSRDEFKKLALCDGLTGLANRACFDQVLTRGMSRARRYHTGLAVLFIDLNGFKPVNDRFGHEAGDAALREVAERLSKVIRQEDVLARVGGDEFALLLGDLVDSPAEATRVVNHCRQAMMPPILFRGQELVISLSIGQASFPEDGETAEGLMAAADRAMYLDKHRQALGEISL